MDNSIGTGAWRDFAKDVGRIATYTKQIATELRLQREGGELGELTKQVADMVDAVEQELKGAPKPQRKAYLEGAQATLIRVGQAAEKLRGEAL
jgi:hypothetical protein